uniref:Uncharacterized protein n=1 Tax=Meloidogyne javanica TaxID=6303 RepID=A0A915MML5_MELJA
YFIKKNFEKDEDEMSDLSCSSNKASNYVENEWSDLEENNQRSRESEEAELKERFKEAFSQLSKGEYEKTAQICTSILIHPIMQNFYISDWEAFDWIENKRKKEIGSIIHSDMAKIYFNINLALFGILDNSLDFYIQALSIHPELKDLWFLAGITASKQKDWRSARFCFGHCDDDIRKLEALILFRHILNKFEQLIRTNNSNNSTQFGLFSSVLNKLLPKFAPLKIKLRNDMRMEDIGICLCNIFDRIEQFSSFAEQKIIFYMDNTTNNSNTQATQNQDDLMQIDQVETVHNVNNVSKNTAKENCNGTLREKSATIEQQPETKLKEKYYQKRSQHQPYREQNENSALLRRSERVQNSPKYFNIAESWAWNVRWIEDLPNFNPLIEAFMEASKNENWEFSQYLYKFLQFICEKKNVGLTLGQAEIFRQVYIRWSSTFLNLSLDNTQQTLDLLIHQMAAELGSHRALSILQLFFDGELNFNNNKNMRPPKLNTQKEKEVAEIYFDKNKLNKNQLDLFKWIFERIANEQKEEKLKDKPEGTDIMGETTSTDTQNNSVSEQNERLRDLEIRYRWLTSNLQPNELGLLLQQQSSESIHFAYIYCQLKIALNLIINSENGNSVKIFTNANFGINCLSKRNLEEFLKKKVGEKFCLLY